MSAEGDITWQKALEINLDARIYGVLAEIGAGQEVARWFFRVGRAAGTIAKTMSAYDMTVSDQIYGKAGRYVSRERLPAMLDHEYGLLVERLGASRGDQTCFFAFADTLAARNYQGTNSRLDAIIFGAEDYAASVGATRTKEATEVLYARLAVVAACAANDLQAIDIVYIDFKDMEGLRAEAEQGAGFGFSGKQIIHPNQVQVTQEAFTPSDSTIAYAKRVIASFESNQKEGKGAYALDGKMIDMPLIRNAKKFWIGRAPREKYNLLSRKIICSPSSMVFHLPWHGARHRNHRVTAIVTCRFRRRGQPIEAAERLILDGSSTDFYRSGVGRSGSEADYAELRRELTRAAPVNSDAARGRLGLRAGATGKRAPADRRLPGPGAGKPISGVSRARLTTEGWCRKRFRWDSAGRKWGFIRPTYALHSQSNT